MARRKKVRSVTVIGRRWFDRVNGNTYCGATVLVNGVAVASFGPRYGYGSQYEQEAAAVLQELGYMPGREQYPNGGAEPAWRYFRERMGAAYYSTVTDVARKGDL